MDARTLTFIREIIKFLLKVYQKFWMRCPNATMAPYDDLQLLKEIVEYRSINAEISNIAFASFSKHLWYYNETKVGLAFFDDRISFVEKRKMVQALQNESISQEEKITIERSEVRKKRIHYLVTSRTLTFFKDFEISTSWLKKDPKSWCTDCDYKSAKCFFEQMMVVNDCAERGIKLIQYVNKSSKDEEEIQNKIQVIEENRKLYNNDKKDTVLTRKIPQSETRRRK